jgi:branched-chain amino acid transport system ATP-binding protein
MAHKRAGDPTPSSAPGPAPPATATGPAAPNLLALHDVHSYYGDSHILHGVGLAVAPGECVALLGRNGAGKTTTIRTIVGFTPARAGSVVFRGHDVTRLAPHHIARLGVGLVPQGRRIFPDLTVHENLCLAQRSRTDGWTLAKVHEYFPRLRERARQRAGTMSGGEQQKLSILLVEQNLAFALSLVDRVYVMNKGQIVFSGGPDALAADETVKHQFLGV